jgi:hypothetical protein
MSQHQHSTRRDAAPPPQRPTIAAALAGQPASFWVASVASLGIIIGGVGPWATAFGFVSLSGTSMHGWRAVILGAAGLAMLALYQLRAGRLAPIFAAVAGALGAIQAISTLDAIHSGGAITVLGQQYRYLEPAWGLYLVLLGAIALACSASALAWRARAVRNGQRRPASGPGQPTTDRGHAFGTRAIRQADDA